MLLDEFQVTLAKEKERLSKPPCASGELYGMQEKTAEREVKKAGKSYGKKKGGRKKKSLTLSNRLVLGSRVYARYPMQGTSGRDYYWGTIVYANGNPKLFDVHFDDGDLRVNGAFVCSDYYVDDNDENLTVRHDLSQCPHRK